MSREPYTQLGKWYTIVYLGLLATAFGVIAIHGVFAKNLLLPRLWLMFLLAVLLIVTIVGILQAKRWAKWIAIAVYSVYLLGSVRSLINSISLSTVFNLFDSRTVLLIRGVYGVAIGLSGLGIVVLLQKPRRDRVE